MSRLQDPVFKVFQQRVRMLNEKDEDGYKITDRSTATLLKVTAAVTAKVSVQTLGQ